MRRHELPDTTPYDSFNYGLYGGYHALQLAVLAEHLDTVATQSGAAEQSFIVDDLVARVREELSAFRNNLGLFGLADPDLELIDRSFGKSMKHVFSGRHAYHPSGAEPHANVPQKREDQGWTDWLANDAPDEYLLGCLQVRVEEGLPEQGRAPSIEMQKPQSIGAAVLQNGGDTIS
ncbi:MAG: hypothetical protein ABWX94_02795 [Candidatus Saccharimonadales bacterium]